MHLWKFVFSTYASPTNVRLLRKRSCSSLYSTLLYIRYSIHSTPKFHPPKTETKTSCQRQLFLCTVDVSLNSNSRAIKTIRYCLEAMIKGDLPSCYTRSILIATLNTCNFLSSSCCLARGNIVSSLKNWRRDNERGESEGNDCWELWELHVELWMDRWMERCSLVEKYEL